MKKKSRKSSTKTMKSLKRTTEIPTLKEEKSLMLKGHGVRVRAK